MIKKVAVLALPLAFMAHFASAETSIDGAVRAVAVPQGSQLGFEVEGWPKDANGVMAIVSGPKEYYAEVEFGDNVPFLDLPKYGEMVDGVYSWEIRGGTGEKVKKREFLDNGREGKDVEYDIVGFAVGGSVVVKGGVIVKFGQGAEKGSEETKPTDEESKDGDKGGESEKPNPGKDETNDGDKG